MAYNTKRLLNIGDLVISRGVKKQIHENPDFLKFVQLCLGKFIFGDWGNTCEEYKKRNDEAVNCEGKIIAIYHCKSTDDIIWIVSETYGASFGADRNLTTILFPEEF